MTKIEWDQDNDRLYETGTDRVVLYKKVTEGDNIGSYGEGVAWNGFTGLSESPSGAEETALWANNQKYLSLYSREEFGGTIKAYTYPPEWEECDGSAEVVNSSGVTIAQQTRVGFGLTYRTLVGNSVLYEDYGYKIHIVYGATASPSSKDYQTINDSPEAIEFSWEFKTVPVNVEGFKPTSRLTIDKNKIDAGKLKIIEDLLYGTASTPPTLPTPKTIIDIVKGEYVPEGAQGETGSTGATGVTGN